MLSTEAYVPADRKNSPISIMHALKAMPRTRRQPCPVIQLEPSSALLMRKYATPQKMNPKNESNRELISERRSEKNGMTSAITKAKIQVTAKIVPQADQPRRVCSPSGHQF